MVEPFCKNCLRLSAVNYFRINVPSQMFDDSFTDTRCYRFNRLTNVPHHIETSQMICNAFQLTGFYMIGNIGR